MNTTRKSYVLRVVILTLLGICPLCESRAGGSDFSLGNSMEEVKGALGKPQGTMKARGRSIWVYPGGTVEFENGRVVSSRMLSREDLVKEEQAKPRHRKKELYQKNEAYAKNLAEAKQRLTALQREIAEKARSAQDRMKVRIEKEEQEFRQRWAAGRPTFQDHIDNELADSLGIRPSDIRSERVIASHEMVEKTWRKNAKSQAVTLVGNIASLEKRIAEQVESTRGSSDTGFFISKDGYILTAYHVVSRSRRISIRMDDAIYEAKVIAKSKSDDIVILKAKGVFESLPLGDSEGA